MKTISQITNLIAHRGLSSEYHENTLPAFLGACQKPFFGIETDVQFTKDNKAICFHDKSLKHFNGEKFLISELNYRDLMHLRYSLSDPKSTICPFRKYLLACKKYKKFCIIEIKYKMDFPQIKLLIKQIKFYRYIKNCVFISFNADVLIKIRELLPNAKIQLLVSSPIKRYSQLCQKYKFDVSFYDRIISKDMVDKVHASGHKVGVWTVNKYQNALKYANWGVDYITSDYLL